MLTSIRWNKCYVERTLDWAEGDFNPGLWVLITVSLWNHFLNFHYTILGNSKFSFSSKAKYECINLPHPWPQILPWPTFPSCTAGPLLARDSCPRILLALAPQKPWHPRATRWCCLLIQVKLAPGLQTGFTRMVQECPSSSSAETGLPQWKAAQPGLILRGEVPRLPWFCCGDSSIDLAADHSYIIYGTQCKMKMSKLLVEAAQGMPKSQQNCSTSAF